MQPNELTFHVDVLNNNTLVDKLYERYEDGPNRSVYVTSAHTPAFRDQVTLLRTLPTKTGNFKGVSKGSLKLTADQTVLGVDGSNVQAPLILELSFSAPVGATAAVIKEYRQRVIAMLDDDTFMDKLMIQQQV